MSDEPKPLPVETNNGKTVISDWPLRATLGESQLGSDSSWLHRVNDKRLQFTPDSGGYAEYDLVRYDAATKISTIERRLFRRG